MKFPIGDRAHFGFVVGEERRVIGDCFRDLFPYRVVVPEILGICKVCEDTERFQANVMGKVGME